LVQSQHSATGDKEEAKQSIANNDYIQVQNHAEEDEDENDFFQANDKDMMDQNLKGEDNYGNDDDDDDEEQDPNEDAA
jgi:hypothetical protein